VTTYTLKQYIWYRTDLIHMSHDDFFSLKIDSNI